MTGFRVDQGGLIDRGDTRKFLFDGRWYEGFAGDTLASALLANGVRTVGRSFKYHRPRGLWGAWADDPNGFMDVTLNHRSFPNCQSATTYLEARMEARAVNAWPSARFDLKGGLDLFHRWLGAGFYYKTFMWPDWHLFEPMIRHMAGLGYVTSQDLDRYLSDQVNASCDVLVIGAGPAGLIAARAVAERGADVILVDDHNLAGGSAFRLGTVEGKAAAEWIAEQTGGIEQAGGRMLSLTTALGVYDHGLVALVQNTGFGRPPKLWRVRPKQVILATGALDRPVTFDGNDRPGVMSLQAAWEYLARYDVLAGRSICVLANNSHAESAIAALDAAGAEVTRVDPARAPVRSFGPDRLRGIQQGNTRHFVDVVCASGGLTPLVHLWRHAGGKLNWREDLHAFVPAAGPDDMRAVGAANGTFNLNSALEEARAVGAGKPAPSIKPSYRIAALAPEVTATGRQWIDFQHDVTLKDIAQAAAENYTSVEHLKRYTTLGMAADQGKTSNMAGLEAMAALRDVPIPEVGTTTFRPPYTPVPLTTYRGPHSKQHYHPLKRLPLEGAHRAANAALGEYGGWLRPAWYGDQEKNVHIHEEVLRARETVGLFDASPLGKIEVMGPDAENFLNFIYYNTVATLKPGAIRYGFMLTEGGVIFDDGVLTRLGPEHFMVSCSSGHVAAVHRMLQLWRQDGNDPDRIFIHDVTAQWATLTVTGPRAREVVAQLALDVDLSASNFPHMQMREARFQGQDMRLARVSFTGDLSFELSVPVSTAQALWESLTQAIETQGGALLGLEALSIMRAEKGYIIAGRDTDGLSMPHDLGFGGPRAKKKVAFVGDCSLHNEMANDPKRRQLVGLIVPEVARPLPTGAHVLEVGRKEGSIGIVTSSYFSPTLGHPIALALINGGATRHGEPLDIYHLGDRLAATVCAPCFVDPEGERLHA